MRPSLLRPPAPPNTVICGVTCTSVGPPPIVTMPGISSAVAAHDRAVGIDVSTSLLMVVWRRMLCTSTIGVTPDDGDRLGHAADRHLGVDLRGERAGQLDALALAPG